MAINQALYARRNLAFAPTLNIYYSGDQLPLDGATINIEVRLYGGQAGPPCAQALNIPFSDPEVSPDRRRLTLLPVIPKAVLQAMPGLHQPEAGDTQRFVQEIKVTYADGGQDLLWFGDFVLGPGVNAA